MNATPIAWFGDRPVDDATTNGRRHEVWLCDWCSGLNDPANLLLCPCEANAVTKAEVTARHRAAARRARHRVGQVAA